MMISYTSVPAGRPCDLYRAPNGSLVHRRFSCNQGEAESYTRPTGLEAVCRMRDDIRATAIVSETGRVGLTWTIKIAQGRASRLFTAYLGTLHLVML